MRGQPLAEDLRTGVREDLATLRDHGITPTLGTVLMSDDDADKAFMNRKHELCEKAGIPTKRVDIPPNESAEELYRTVERLGADDDVTSLFVQVPLPDHIEASAVRNRVPPTKDIDCFAPENLGRLVVGDPWVTPVTPAAVLQLLAGYDIETRGKDVVVIGRNTAICKPLANLFLAHGPGGDATVTICHTATTDLAAKTQRADILVTAAGVPRLVDGAMISDGVSIIDISVNRIDLDTEKGYELVGDVDFESAKVKASAITPVPGGVGPLTLTLILRNIVDVTARQAGLKAALLESDSERCDWAWSQ
ncbi:bifunctional 5,10-methylenetetrahydrofolate dehydrogenase/5,10-methenyltetrahydrofolate cyclohydrolase [Haladaptatus sp. DFWS20]|uniref:bifunctional 5,10-methylenetetrahydrofolate dehydrogenase/5,10-methenyltetrahydrofolate cyclohydrolase n=1 Tax=Haladaptatus sp. DFWS20 TaxID=3403467 RepID=UPI003EBB677A